MAKVLLSYIISDNSSVNDRINYTDDFLDEQLYRNTFRMIFKYMNQEQHFNMMMGIGQGEEDKMRISYNKLWKLLIDKNMTKMELKEAAGVAAPLQFAKLGKGANITTDVLLKICGDSSLPCRGYSGNNQ